MPEWTTQGAVSSKSVALSRGLLARGRAVRRSRVRFHRAPALIHDEQLSVLATVVKVSMRKKVFVTVGLIHLRTRSIPFGLAPAGLLCFEVLLLKKKEPRV